MPEEDGYALLRRVRAHKGPIGRIPAVAVTAHAGAEDRKEALAAGFQRMCRNRSSTLDWSES